MAHRSFFLLSLFVSLLAFLCLATAESGRCSESSPCTSGCCSSLGYCGFGDDYCGDGCVSSCNATAECGQYAAVPGTKCPLNVCCSQYGFCGTTSEFCDSKCQNGCDKVSSPSCSSSSSKKTIGYYESWSYQRACDSWDPSDIDATKWTHLNYAFALIDESSYEISQMNSFDTQLYPKFTDLKSQNPGLRVYISIGGWDAGGAIFSSMTSSSSNRAAFINSAKKFMKTYAFDGIDIDWEYPVADDRGGAKEDKDNFVTFLKELRAALGDEYGITATLPSSYWYMQHFDIVNMEPYLDWFNIMTYDIHGTWDGKNPYTSAVVQAHTNLTEINEAMELLWRNNIDSSKVVMGLGFYGRSFTLSDSGCTTPGCAFSAGGNPGKCTANSGTLSYNEIQGIISDNNLTPILVEDAAVKYITWDRNQWVSYDDTDTFKLKLQYADKNCLGGTMAWALDLDQKTSSDNSTAAVDALSLGSSQALGGETEEEAKKTYMRKITVRKENAAGVGVFWTACLPPGSQSCPDGYKVVVSGHGKVFDADQNHVAGEGCHGGGQKGFNRVLCAQNNVDLSCQWGPGKESKSCNSKCPTGYITLTKNSHIAGQKSGCKSGKYAPVCCEHINVFYLITDACSKNDVVQHLSGGLAVTNKLASSDARSYDYSGGDANSDAFKKHRKLKAKRELAVQKRALKKRELEETCSAIDADGNTNSTNAAACLKKRGENFSTSCGRQLGVDELGVDAQATLERVTQNGKVEFTAHATIGTGDPGSDGPDRKKRKTATVTSKTTVYSTGVRTCDGERYPQACMNYRSVASHSTYSIMTCSDIDADANSRPLVSMYNSQHHKKWVNTWLAKSYTNPQGKKVLVKPQRDEWPPAHFQQGRRDGYVRLLPGGQNQGPPGQNPKVNGWKGFCKFPPESQVNTRTGSITDISAIPTIYVTSTITLNVMSYTWTSIPSASDDGLTENPCWPSTLVQDPGFALLTGDPWYNNHHTLQQSAAQYRSAPAADLIGDKSPPKERRDLTGNEAAGTEEAGKTTYLWDEERAAWLANDVATNTTRLATDEEIRDVLQLQKCETPDCAREIAIWNSYNAELGLPTDIVAPAITMTTTLASATPLGDASGKTLVTSTAPVQGKLGVADVISQPTATTSG